MKEHAVSHLMEKQCISRGAPLTQIFRETLKSGNLHVRMQIGLSPQNVRFLKTHCLLTHIPLFHLMVNGFIL